MVGSVTVADQSSRVITLADIARVVADVKWYWVGGALVGFIIALSAGFLMRPVYRATAVVMPATARDLGGGAVAGLLSRIGGDIGIGGAESSERDEALAVLKSRQFVEKFISDEKLLPVLFAEKWDSDAGVWLETDPDRIPSAWDGWMLFDRTVRTVLEDRDRGLVTIRIEWFDPELAALWANGLVSRANEDLRLRKLQQIEARLEFLKAELAKSQLVELRTAISKVMEAQINERMLANSRPEYAFRVIDPAIAPDRDQPERPKRLLMAALGLAAGAILGLVGGLAVGYFRQQPSPPGGS